MLGLVPRRRAARGSAAHALMTAARMSQSARAIAGGPADDDQAWPPRMPRRALRGIGPPRRTPRLTHPPSRTQVRFQMRQEVAGEVAGEVGGEVRGEVGGEVGGDAAAARARCSESSRSRALAV